MSDLIERSEVLKQLWLNHKDVVYIDKNECARRIEAIPSARPKGKWIYQFRDSENEEYRCSVCGFPQEIKQNFCPNCGADMRGE